MWSNLLKRSDIELQEATFTNRDSDGCWLRQKTSNAPVKS